MFSHLTPHRHSCTLRIYYALNFSPYVLLHFTTYPDLITLYLTHPSHYKMTPNFLNSCWRKQNVYLITSNISIYEALTSAQSNLEYQHLFFYYLFILAETQLAGWGGVNVFNRCLFVFTCKTFNISWLQNTQVSRVLYLLFFRLVSIVPPVGQVGI